MTALSVKLRPINDQDQPFLFDVYCSTRQEELANVGWSEAQTQTFLQMQFTAQHQHYQKNYEEAEYSVILKNEQPVGRLYLDYRPDEIRIIDIALLSAFRYAGIGSHLLHTVLGEAKTTGLPVRIHVEKNNPALSWYTRLGFTIIADAEVYHLMECLP